MTHFPFDPSRRSRRDFLAGTAGAFGTAALASSGLFARPSLASEAMPPIASGKATSCIMIWLGGGMSQVDTFDCKRLGDPKTKKAGSAYPTIPTAVPGVEVCEYLPRLADRLDRVTTMRSVHHDVIDEHAAAVNRMHTGRPVSGTVVYPSIGSAVAHLAGPAEETSPAYVVIGYPNVTRGPGFLGPKAGYLYLTDTESGPKGLTPPPGISPERIARRRNLLDRLRGQGTITPTGLEAAVSGSRPVAIETYDQILEEAQRLSGPSFMKTFNLDEESSELRQAYGGEFGQRCLVARRLTERGVRFVEVSHNLNFVNGTGWDTHNEGQLNQHILIDELDQAMAALIDDLESRGRLDQTLIVVASEFGRPSAFDGGGGRGHQGAAFSVVLAGGGLAHRGAVGVTDELCKAIVDRPISVPDFHATVYHALGLDPAVMLYDGDRPVPLTDGGRPVAELFG